MKGSGALQVDCAHKASLCRDGQLVSSCLQRMNTVCECVHVGKWAHAPVVLTAPFAVLFFSFFLPDAEAKVSIIVLHQQLLLFITVQLILLASRPNNTTVQITPLQFHIMISSQLIVLCAVLLPLFLFSVPLSVPCLVAETLLVFAAFFF